jgi:hypothetical protein
VTGRLVVIGLGPGNPDQMTPEARAAIAKASDFFGYGPYVDRLELGPGQTRHASDNREELARGPPPGGGGGGGGRAAGGAAGPGRPPPPPPGGRRPRAHPLWVGSHRPWLEQHAAYSTARVCAGRARTATPLGAV